MSNPFKKGSLIKQNGPQQQKSRLQPTIYNPQLPFSSPVADDQRSVQSTNTYQTHNPFLSPNPSRTPSVGEESDSTYGQDEFPLERYSQSTKNGISGQRTRRRSTEINLISQSRGDSPTRKLRPGLNIITDLARPDGRSLTDGMVVEHVQASRPQLGHRSVTSVASQKVEHGFQAQSISPPQPSGFVNLKDLAKLHEQGKERSRNKHERNPIAPIGYGNARGKGFTWRSRRNPDEEIGARPGLRPETIDGQAPDGSPMAGKHRGDFPPRPVTKNISPADRSIVIGITVPKDQADAHLPKAGDSALSLQTPSTPAIVVTAAEEKPRQRSNERSDRTNAPRRPVSSVYSQMTTKDKFYFADEDAPPLPTLRNKDGFILDHTGQPTQVDLGRRSERDLHRPHSIRSFETIFDEDAELPHKSRPRSASAESHQQILTFGSDSGRPKSKGWWNLMLSPMLSRAGTQRAKKSPDFSGIPPIPALYKSEGDDVPVHEDENDTKISPETPRRLGLAVNRASTWSSWTDFGKEVDGMPEEKSSPSKNKTFGHKAQASAVTVPFMMGDTPKGEGFAAEYYFACAVDERGGAPYFACENHSCVDRLPALGFVPMEKTIRTPVCESRADHHLRSVSDSTIMDDGPMELSPNVRLANVAPILKAKALGGMPPSVPDGKKNSGPSLESPSQLPLANKTPGPPAYSPARSATRFPNLASVVLPTRQQPPASPGPISPEMQRAMAPQGAVPMAMVQTRETAGPIFFTNNTRYPDLPPHTNMAPVSSADIERPKEIREKGETRRQRLEKEDAIARKAGNLWRGRGCFPKNGCFGREGPKGRKKRRWYLFVGSLLLAIIITSIVLATQFTRKADNTPVQSQWLNLTGFPPMPIGISTIAQPDAATEDSSCVQPPEIWSCAVPKEVQASIAPNDPDQPNFRFEIRFRNGTVPAGETIPLNSTMAKLSRVFSAHKLSSRQNDPFTNALYTPSPASPNTQEQIFLGNTTDNITLPFNGEETPFFITFISTTPVLPAAFNETNHSSSSDHQSKRSSTSIANAIPPPQIGLDGSAAAANLLPNDPLPFSQPVRLYNRGSSQEHYGFYTYFDRAIFLKSDQLLNSSAAFDDIASTPDDQNGGSPKSEATLRCTWSQTRFLVKIWTSPNFGAKLLGSPVTSADGIPNNSAIDFTTPGSFPYPVSITLDRHGGNLDKKALYCYGMDEQGHIVVSEKAVVPESRSFGGIAINPAPPLVQTPGEADGFDPNAGGIDGGTGGCECEWRNWIGVF